METEPFQGNTRRLIRPGFPKGLDYAASRGEAMALAGDQAAKVRAQGLQLRDLGLNGIQLLRGQGIRVRAVAFRVVGEVQKRTDRLDG